MEVAAFLFDYDGTLVDTEKAWASSIVDMLKERGAAVELEELLPAIVGRNWIDIDRWLHERFPQMGDTTAQEDADELRRHFVKYAVDYDSMKIASSVDFLKRAARIAPCAVVTGSPRADVEEGLRRIGALDAVKLVLGAGEYEAGKPSPSGYLKAAELLGVDPARCVAIEDSSVGVASAVAAGMKVVALDRSSSVIQTFAGETWKVKDLAGFDFEKEFS